MTPRGWIKDTLNRWPAGHHVAEGATHLAAALKEIARLRADASTASPSCDRCQSAHCCSVRDESAKIPLCVTDPDGSLPLWMPWTNADVQARVNPLHAEIDRLRAEAGRVVVPELTEYQTDVIASMEEDIENDDFEAMKNHLKIGHVHELVAIIADIRAHSVPSSRILKDGEVAVTRAELGPLRLIANQFRRGDREWILEYTVPVEMALDALRALRTQATATESGKAREVEG